MWDLPLSVKIDGKEHKIRSDCDYRVVLDVLSALGDEDLPPENRMFCALKIFYADLEEISNYEEAAEQMIDVINLRKKEAGKPDAPRLMDWEYDFNYIAPAVSRVLGYDVRTPNKYTHWWSFMGGFSEAGDCLFNFIVAIRTKLSKGQKLEKHEQAFYRENRKAVDLPEKLTEEEREWLNSEW